MKYLNKIVLCLCLTSILACSSQREIELYNNALIDFKQKSQNVLIDDIKEFNSYPNRPKSDGIYNADNVEEFLLETTPRFLSSNDDFTEVYNYRWWMISKHLRPWKDTVENKKYWVFTEFYGWPAHGSQSGAIPCPAGHQFYDLRWMRDPQYLCSFMEYYMGGSASKNNQRENDAFHSHISRPESHHFSSWMIDGAEAFLKVHPNNNWRDMMLPHMEEHQKIWDDKFKVHKKGSKTDGLYKVLDLYDGMEFTISATMALIESDGAYSIYTEEDWKEYYLGWGPINKMRSSSLNQEHPKAFAKGYPLMYLVRPSINSYYYGNLNSLAKLCELKGDNDKKNYYKRRTEEHRKKTLATLWNETDKFFNSYSAADNTEGVKDWEARVRESVGYSPWYFNMLPKDSDKYNAAWDMLFSKDGFWNTNGMTTAEITHPLYNEQAYAWNGRGWPFQNSMINKAYANYLKNYKKEITDIDRNRLYDLIEKLVILHGEERNIGEWYIPSNGETFGGVKDYFHSSYPDMLIEDLLGFTSSHDNEFTLQALLPEDKWDYFYLGNIRYHNSDIDIIWKKDWDAEKSGNQSKLCVWVNNELVAHSDTLNKKIKITLK